MNPQFSNQDIWVIIPAFNEEIYIESVLQKVANYTNNIIVVDDGSSDQTFLRASKLVKHAVKHPINLGKGAALKTGCELAFFQLHAQAVIFLDGDDQHDPAELNLFMTALKQGHQIIFGERKTGSEMPLLRIIGNRFASFLLYFLFGMYIPDIPSGFKALTNQAYQKVKWSSRDYSVEMEIAVRVAKQKLPFKTVQIATIYHDLDRGMTFLDVLKMSTQMLTWRFSI